MKLKKKRSILITISIIILLFIFLFFSFKNNDLKNLENKVKAQAGQLENKSNDEIEATLNEIIEDGSISISINMNPIFIHGKAKGYLQLENHPNNKYNQRVVIFCDTNNDGQKEEIYHSGLMPINSHIQSDTLEKNLSKGEYEATAIFTAYDIETDNEIGRVASEIQISVLS